MADKEDSGGDGGCGGFTLALPLTINILPFFILYVFQHKGLDY